MGFFRRRDKRRSSRRNQACSLGIERLEDRRLLSGSPPVLTSGSISNLTVAENSGFTSVGLSNVTFAPGAGNSGSLTYTITAVPNPNLGYLVDGYGTTIFAAANGYNQGNFNLSNLQNLQFWAAPNTSGGPATFSFNVTDSGGNTLSESLTITVTPSAGPFYTVVDLTPNANGFNGSLGYGITVGQQGGAILSQSGVHGVINTTNAALWTGTAGSVVDLNPVGATFSQIDGISGSQQVGNAVFTTGSSGGDAMSWTGSAASAVDLTPAGYYSSTALSVGGGDVVGYGEKTSSSGGYEAFLWTGTSTGNPQLTNLTPAGTTNSSAGGTDGTQQVGLAAFATTIGQTVYQLSHAVIWTGTAASMVDINPSGAISSEAFAVQGGHQVGDAGLSLTGPDVAALWSGTANSFVDLNPSGFADSEARGVYGNNQVGDAHFFYGPSNILRIAAFKWSGSAASAVNLDNFLSFGVDSQGNTTGFNSYSWARGVDANGDVIGYATDANNLLHAVMWVPIDAPPISTGGVVNDVRVLKNSGFTSLGLSSLNYALGGGPDEAGQTLSYQVTAVPDASLGSVVLADGSTVVTPGNYTLAQLQGLQFNTQPGATGGPSTFAFNVIASGGSVVGQVETLPQSLTITVLPPPVQTGGTISNLTVLENSGTTTLGFAGLTYAPGGNQPGQTFTYTVTATPSASLGSVVLADGTTLVTANTSYTLSQLQGMQFKPATNAAGGPASFAFNVQEDGVAGTLAQSMAIRVTPYRQPPVLVSGSLSNVTVAENSGSTSLGLSNVTYAPGAGESGPLTYTITAVPDPSLGYMVVENGVAIFAAANGYDQGNFDLYNLQNLQFWANPNTSGGPATFSFNVTDSSGATLSQSLTITVTPSTGPFYKVVDLLPSVTGFNGSLGSAVTVGQQGGEIVNQSATNKAIITEHAAFWTGTAGSAVDLNPSGSTFSAVGAVSGNQQVGVAAITTAGGTNSNAILWAGTAASAVDLNPAGFIYSTALGIGGSEVVGYGEAVAGGNYTALLWTGTNTNTITTINLTPIGDASAGANATDGTQQVGFTQVLSVVDPNSVENAALWSGTAASVVDLNPSGYASSSALAIQGGHQVGDVVQTITSLDHAALWSGSANSFVDLNPAGFADSEALGVYGNNQVGYAIFAPTNLGRHDAILWSGTAASAVNLDNYLSFSIDSQGHTRGFIGGSEAYGIDANGDIIGTTRDVYTGLEHAVMWVPIPGNSPPVRTAGNVNNLTVIENSGLNSLGLSGLAYQPAANETGPLTYTVTAVPSASLGKVLLSDGTTAVAAGSSYTLAQLQGMQFSPATNATGGPATFSFNVLDANSDALAQSLTITVNPPNQPPVQTGGIISNLTVVENASLAPLGFAGVTYGPGGGANEAGQTLTYTVTAVPSPSLGSVFLADGTTAVTTSTAYTLAQLQGMQFGPAFNAFGGPATFAFNVQDNGGTAFGGVDTLAQSIQISVTSYDRPPVQTGGVINNLRVLQNAGFASLGLAGLTYALGGGANETGQTLSCVVTAVPSASLGSMVLADNTTVVNVGAAYTLAQLQGMQFNTQPGAIGGPSTFAYNVVAGGGTVAGQSETLPQSLTVTILPPPVQTGGTIGNLTVLENAGPTPLGFAGVTYAPGGNQTGLALSYSVTALPTSLGSVVLSDGTTLVTAGTAYTLAQLQGMQFKPGVNLFGGPATFGFSVVESGVAGGLAQSIEIAVTSFDRPPVLTGGFINNLQVLANSGPVSLGLSGLTYALGGGANEGGQALSYTATAVPSASLGSILLADGTTVVTAGTSYTLAQLQGMQFQPAAGVTGGPATFAFNVQAGGGTVAGAVETLPQSLTVTILPPPVQTGGTISNLTVLENAGPTPLGFAGVTYAPGGNQTGLALSYSVTAVPTSLGSVVLSDGTTLVTAGTSYTLAQLQGMQFKPGVNLFGGPATFGFSVVESGVAGGLAQSIEIAVTSFDRPPILTGGALNNVTVLENSGLTSLGFGGLTYALGGGANETGQTLSYTATAVPAASLGSIVLSDGATAVAAGSSYTLSQLQGMKFKTATNAAGGPATFAFNVRAGGGAVGGAVETLAQSIAITVTPVNQPPVLTAGALKNLAVTKNAALTSLGLSGLAYGPGGGANEATQTLTYTVTAVPSASLGNIYLANGTTVVTAGTSYTLAQLQGMEFKPAANASGGPATFSFNVKDNGGTAKGGVDTLSQSLTITVTTPGVNVAPSFTKGANQTVRKNAGAQTVIGWATNISAGPASEATQTLTFQVTGDTNPGLFSFAPVINAKTGTLAYTPKTGVSGTATITLVLKDNGGTANGGHDTSVSQTFTITVTG